MVGEYPPLERAALAEGYLYWQHVRVTPSWWLLRGPASCTSAASEIPNTVCTGSGYNSQTHRIPSQASPIIVLKLEAASLELYYPERVELR